MIKFIIVDDDKKWLKEYERIINDIFFKSEKEYEIYPFTKYDNELQKLIKDNQLDVLEAQKVLDFFEKYYQIFKNENSSVLLVPRANFLDDEIPERNLEETDIAYLRRIKNTLASKHLTVKENISPNQILIINYNPNKTLKKDS